MGTWNRILQKYPLLQNPVDSFFGLTSAAPSATISYRFRSVLRTVFYGTEYGTASEKRVGCHQYTHADFLVVRIEAFKHARGPQEVAYDAKFYIVSTLSGLRCVRSVGDLKKPLEKACLSWRRMCITYMLSAICRCQRLVPVEEVRLLSARQPLQRGFTGHLDRRCLNG